MPEVTRKPPQHRNSKMVQITLPPEYLSRIDAQAKQMGLNRSELVRRAIDYYLLFVATYPPSK